MNKFIEYLNKITPKNNNIVIFVSNISQLKNIDFLPNIKNYIKDRQFKEEITSKNFLFLSNILSKENKLLNINIHLRKKISNNYIKLGSEICTSLENLKLNEITFYFSDYLINKDKKMISYIIFGFCLKS